MYTLDTNTIIYYLACEPKAVSFFEDFIDKDIQIYVSTITITELYSHRNLNDAGRQAIENVLNLLLIVPVDTAVARMAGTIRSQYRLKTPDSIIAATAMSTRTILVTRNITDFKKIAEISVQKI